MRAKTVVPEVTPLPSLGPGGGFTSPVGVPKQQSSSGTRSSTSKTKKIPRPGSSKAPLQQHVSASEGQSSRQGKSETSTLVEENNIPQSSTVKDKRHETLHKQVAASPASGKTAETVVSDVKPLPPSGPGGVSTHPVDVQKQKTSTGTSSSTSKSKEILRPGSSKATLLQPFSASEGQSYHQSEP